MERGGQTDLLAASPTRETSFCDLEEALYQLCNSPVIFSFPGFISRDFWVPIKVEKQTFVCEQAINISVWGLKGGWLTNKWNTEELLMFTASTVESANIQFACGCNQERVCSAAASVPRSSTAADSPLILAFKTRLMHIQLKNCNRLNVWVFLFFFLVLWYFVCSAKFFFLHDSRISK